MLWSYQNNKNIPPTSINIVKIPFTNRLFNFFNNNAPTTPPTITPTITDHPTAKSIEFLVIYIIELAILIGRITNIAVACACFCVSPNFSVKSGTTIIPPPPPKKPLITPINAPKRIICDFFMFFIKLFYTFWQKIFAKFSILYYNKIVLKIISERF